MHGFASHALIWLRAGMAHARLSYNEISASLTLNPSVAGKQAAGKADYLVSAWIMPDTNVTEVTLLADTNIIALSAIPLDGCQRNYDLSAGETFSLPLTIYDYVDLRTVWGNTESGVDEDAVLL